MPTRSQVAAPNRRRWLRAPAETYLGYGLCNVYAPTESFWRPELSQDPPDMAALMPRWIAVGLATTFGFAGLYGWIRGGLNGAPWMKGRKFGLLLSVVACCFMAGWSGVFALPNKIWLWWGLAQFVYNLPGGAVLGWVGQKLVPEPG